MFRGIFETTIDAKGRTILPAKFRETLVAAFGDERFFLTNSTPVRLSSGASCSGLAIYPYQNWLEIEGKLENNTELNLSLSELAAVRRRIIAPATECVADKLGRILIPPHLRKNAALEREIIFVSVQNKVEIWSMAEWDRVQRQDDENFPSDSQALTTLGL